VCGEAAGDDAAALLLVGLGIRKLSVGAALVRHIAGRVAGAETGRLSAAAAKGMAAGSAEAARAAVSALRL
jgi:phosphoenolpyruvate-protein kinase (PTS system EI component)